MKNSPDTQTSHTSWLRRIFGSPENPSAAPTQATETTPTQTQKPARNQRVLLVDDDPLFLTKASRALELDGYEVITAKDGCEAIQIARKQHPNLMVLDVQLPQDFSGVPWDGYRIISWLRRMDSLKDTPVVVATCGDASQTARESFRAGAMGYYHKRWEQSHLLTLVEQALARKANVRPKSHTPPDTNFQS